MKKNNNKTNPRLSVGVNELVHIVNSYKKVPITSELSLDMIAFDRQCLREDVGPYNNLKDHFNYRQQLDFLNEAFVKISAFQEKFEPILFSLRQNPQIEFDKSLSIEEAASIVQFSRPMINGIIRRGELPIFKRGKRRYTKFSDLLAYVLALNRESISDIEECQGLFKFLKN